MRGRKNNKFLFFFGFGLVLLVGGAFFVYQLPMAKALTVDVSACVPGSPVEICDNGIDDNCNGQTDCSDSACTGHPDCSTPCFLPGTQITLSNGQSQSIENIRAGDHVLSYDEYSGKTVDNLVAKIFSHQAANYLVINDELKVTPNHPMYVNGAWKEAGLIKLGDRLLNQVGQIIKVSSIEPFFEDVTVYNLAVENDHNYFAQGYLAHNKGGTYVCGNTIQEPGEQCDDGNTTSGDGCDASCQLEIECPSPPFSPNGYYGRYYNHVPDGDEFQGINTGPLVGTTPFQYDWYDSSFLSLVQSSPHLQFGQFLPLDEGLAGDPFHFAVHWSALINVESTGTYNFELSTDDDSWIYIDNNLVFDNGGTHAAELKTGSTNLSAGYHRVDIYFAERFTDQSYMFFRWTASGIISYPLPDGCSVNGAVCGDGVQETGEQCDDGNIISGDGCSTTCQIEAPPSPVCGNSIVETGEQCDDGNTTSGDGCSDTCQNESTPPGPVCGNAVTETGEQCDDGNTVSGDGCSASCQLEAPELCGNSVVDPGEQCDDGNTVSGDGCSSTCQNETPPGPTPLIIVSHNVTDITLDSAIINWTTNFSSVSSLDWQETISGLGQGSVDNLSGTNFSYTITGLTSGTRYDYSILATRDGEPYDQDSRDGTFVTNFEDLCGDGRCTGDETPESCPQDCVPVCLPDWLPGPWGECIGGIQTRTYQDLNSCPYPLDPPPDQRSCDGGSPVVCGICEQIDLVTRSCTAIWPCCGDRICEETESIENCPVDCGIPPDFRVILTQCLDGFDNDNDGFVDYPADPGCSKPSDNSELNFFEVIQNIIGLLNNPLIEQVNERAAAPAIIALATVNTFATFSLFNFLIYLRYIFTQPLAVLFRRRRKKWGVVYNALSKQPIDLAIVRLYKKENGQLIQSRVTDKRGRFSFIAPPGRYYLTVTKPKYSFPTEYLKDKKEDAKYLDLYHGQTVEITDQNATIIVNIPLDPQEATQTPAKIIALHYLRKIQYSLAFIAVPLAALSLAISPNLFTLSLLILHIFLYIFFRRLGYQRKPKSWGVVYDAGNKKPVGLAITRIYDKQYSKLLESRVTDTKGRYAFLVDNNVYTVTSEKLGYKPSKIDEINLLGKEKETIVDMNIGMEKGQPEQLLSTTPAAPQIQPAPPTKTPDTGVGRQALEKHLQAKPEKPATKPTIDESQLDQLEPKIPPAGTVQEPQPPSQPEPSLGKEEKPATQDATSPGPAEEERPTGSKPQGPEHSIFG